MSVFPDLPAMVPGPIRKGTRTYRLTEGMSHPRGVVPEGYITDGASVPRIFWPIFPHDGASFPSALIHDRDYSHNPSNCTRKQADVEFLKNMEACGLGWLHRHTIYRAVRIGAGGTWRKYRKELMQESRWTAFRKKRR